MEMKENKSQSFTLIELLLVISIVSFLVVIIISGTKESLERARMAKKMTEAASHNRSMSCGEQMMGLEGNLYNTVEIGSQCWMAENLKYLPKVYPSSAGSLVNPHYYINGYQGTNLESAKTHTRFGVNIYNTYGFLYNWPAAITACPPGWHLPTDAEQHTLELYLFSTGDCNPNREAAWDCSPSGSRMKGYDSLYTGWWDDDNSSGFTALPAGGRSTGGNFHNLGSSAYFWSSSELSNDSRIRQLNSTDSGVYRINSSKGSGFSVRCIRD